MRYSVSILDHGHGICERDRWQLFTNLTLTEARRKATKGARRGVKLFGGTVEQMNWGARGGCFPDGYRFAVIKLDTITPRGGRHA